MLTIILKIILCSSIFIAVYYFALEKEKMYRFNRFYLLGSLILSYIIPFITISVRAPETEARPQIIIEEATQQMAFIQPEQESFDWIYVLWGVYAAITLFLLIKSILAVLSIRQLKGKKQIYHDYNILLTQKDLPPFSFWNTIYMGENYAKNNVIDPRIFLHEKSHLDQKHSTDLIIIDILKIFTWFNPLIFLFKKAVVTNHEFLADESVLNEEVNVKEYQNLILDELLAHQNPPLTHSFNFNNTKKRFIMMKAKKTKLAFLRKTTGITTIIAAIALFSEKIYAIETTGTEKNTPINIKNDHATEVSNVKSETTPTDIIKEAKSEKLFTESPATLPELKKEKLTTISDTIAPKANRENNEGKNTNTSANSNANENVTQPEYPDGQKALREKIGKIMDVTQLSPQKGVIKSVAYLHIDASGKTTDIKVSGDNESLNLELLKAITGISNETTWKPGTQDGKAVASVLKIPATLSFAQQ